MNLCILTGNLGGDPDCHHAKNKVFVANFQLAFKSGKDKTNWIKVVCFNKVAHVVEDYLQKGSKVAVVGTLDYNEYTNSDGEDKSQFQLIANSVEFLNTSKKDGKDNEEKQDNDDNDDGIPF